MIHVQVKSDQDPTLLAELIASTQGEEPTDPKIAIEASMIRDQQAQAERERVSFSDMETMNFKTLDAENDWTDL